MAPQIILLIALPIIAAVGLIYLSTRDDAWWDKF
jgi:hypothetical protein